MDYVPGTVSALTTFSELGGFAITESASAAATVNIRDSLTLPTAPSAVVGATGLCTAGVHYICVTYITANGESTIGAQYEITLTGSKHYTITIPVAAPARDLVTGRNIYMTKASAPATGLVPSNAEWFLIATSPVVAEKTSTEYDFNLADASFEADHPPTVDKAGGTMVPLAFAADGFSGVSFDHFIQTYNGGGVYVEVATGAVLWSVFGR